MLDDIRWDSGLIRRYDAAGPRYTSYPTAVQFNDRIGSFDLLHALRDSRKAQRPLSLYVHVPFCANICYYCACNKVITKDRGRALPTWRSSSARSNSSPATSTRSNGWNNCTSAAAPPPFSAMTSCAA